MKVELNPAAPEWEPVTVTFTLETSEECRALAELLSSVNGELGRSQARKLLELNVSSAANGRLPERLRALAHP